MSGTTTGGRRRSGLRERVACAVGCRAANLLEQAEVRRGTRKRALVPIAGGLAALATMFQLVSNNVLAVNFTTANNEFDLYSNYLQGQSAAGFLSVNDTKSGTDTGVAELGIKTAKLAGLCAIAHETILGAPFTLMILSGEPVKGSFNGAAVPDGVLLDTSGFLSGATLDNAITASNLYVNSNSLNGFGNKISGLNLGQSADTVHTTAGITWPTGQTPPTAGNFGLSADKLNVAGLGGETYGINLQGAITLPKLRIKVVPGTKSQADCPTEATN